MAPRYLLHRFFNNRCRFDDIKSCFCSSELIIFISYTNYEISIDSNKAYLTNYEAQIKCLHPNKNMPNWGENVLG